MVRPATTKLSSKRQVVIPEGIRRRMGLEPGAHFVVVGEGDVVVLKALRAQAMSEFGALIEEAREFAAEADLTPDGVASAIAEVVMSPGVFGSTSS